jgi:2-polyprenyl-3-methyl-5-hydroxy-6-metoxy-1,4-benzoquinol methylase
LHIPAEIALEEFKAALKNRLRKACATFAKSRGRHVCKAGRIYSSFVLPFFSVWPEEAQRNSALRLHELQVQPDAIRGKRILDLGSNVGGMLFSLQDYGPGDSIGVECDPDKVLLTNQIAALNGLKNVTFVQADIDCVNGPLHREGFDTTFCLAVVEHLKKPDRLMHLLAEVTTNHLYFEGNSTTDPTWVQDILTHEGFRQVTYLGRSHDDCIPENNCRPVFHARK